MNWTFNSASFHSYDVGLDNLLNKQTGEIANLCCILAHAGASLL